MVKDKVPFEDILSKTKRIYVIPLSQGNHKKHLLWEPVAQIYQYMNF